MERSIFWATFVTVFLAEAGDKTQLAAMTATAKTGALWTVFLAASAALVCATALGVLAGAALFRAVPAHVLRYASGSAFVAVGLWVLLRG